MSGWELLVDDREKKPYSFPKVESVTTDRLNVGDYTVKGFEDVFAVERKTLDDLASSLGTDRERFENEIERAQALEEFVVVVEAETNSVYDYAGEGYSPEYYSNIYPNSIIGTIDAWSGRYNPLSFNWAGSREGGRQETLRLLDKWYLKHGTDMF